MSVLLPILLVLGLCQGHGARVQGVGSSRSFASSDIRQTGHIKLTPEAEDDKVLQLPGYDNRFTSSHYGMGVSAHSANATASCVRWQPCRKRQAWGNVLRCLQGYCNVYSPSSGGTGPLGCNVQASIG